MGPAAMSVVVVNQAPMFAAPQTVQTVSHQQVTEASKTNNDDDAINEAELKLCCGLGCLSTLLYTTNCWGCSGKSIIACCAIEMCCKADTKPLLCSCDNGCKYGCLCYAISCIKPVTCCAIQNQLCCLVTMAALPTTDEMP